MVTEATAADLNAARTHATGRSSSASEEVVLRARVPNVRPLPGRATVFLWIIINRSRLRD